MGLFNAPNFDFSLLLAEIAKLNTNTTAGNTALLSAFNALQFNQPPLLTTSPAPFTINFSPGEIKEIIPATNSPRRIVIKSLSGEVRLLLGTAENIELSAISVDGDRLIDERWQGAIFGYSADGAEIAVNIEIETANTPTPTPNLTEDDMPYFATQADLITADSIFTAGNNIILNNNIYVYFANTTVVSSGFQNNFELAFNYKSGAFANITDPLYIGTSSSLKAMPAWMIDFYANRTITIKNNEIYEGDYSEYCHKVIIMPNTNFNSPPIDLLPLHANFTYNPEMMFYSLGKTCEVEVTNYSAFSANNLLTFDRVIMACNARLPATNLLPGERIRYTLRELVNYNYSGTDLIVDAIGHVSDQYGNSYYMRAFFDTNSSQTGEHYFYNSYQM